MTYPQQPYPGDRLEPPYGPTLQYGGGLTPPPPRKSGAVIAALAAGVTVVGLGVTGFIVPGFLVSEQSPTAAPPTTVTTTSTKPSDDPKNFLQTLAGALDTRDASALTDLSCELKRPAVVSVIDNASAINQATLVDTKKISARRATGIVAITTDSRRARIEVTITRKDDTWCWSDARATERTRPTSSRPAPTTTTVADSPTAGGKPVAPEALAAIRKFLDSVNTGDAATAKSLLCSDAIATPQKVDELVGYQPNLRIDTGMDGVSSSKESVQLYLTGTAKGQRLDGYATNLWATSFHGPWCIHAFRAVVG